MLAAIKMSFLSLSQLSALSCELTMTHYDELHFWTGGMLVLGAAVGAYYTARLKRSPAGAELVRTALKEARVKAVFYVLLFAFPLVCPPVVATFICRTVDGTSYLVADYRLECGTAAWRKAAAWSAVFVVGYVVGLPLAVLVTVKKANEAKSRWRKRQPKRRGSKERRGSRERSGSKDDDQDESGGDRERSGSKDGAVEGRSSGVPPPPPRRRRRSSFTAANEFVADGYRETPVARYWEGCEMLRKLLLTSAILLFDKGSSTQIALAAALSAGFLVAHCLYEPFKEPLDNRLQTMALVALFGTYFIGLLIKVQKTHERGNGAFDLLLTLLTVVVIAVAGFSAVGGAYGGGSGATSLESSMKVFQATGGSSPPKSKSGGAQRLPPVTAAELDESLRILSAKEGREKRLLERKMSGGQTRVTIAAAESSAAATV